MRTEAWRSYVRVAAEHLVGAARETLQDGTMPVDQAAIQARDFLRQAVELFERAALSGPRD